MTLHVSKLLVELQFDDNVLEVPTLTDSDHEDEKYKADGVPQQACLVLYATMDLSLSSPACHTQYISYCLILVIVLLLLTKFHKLQF